MTRQRVRWTVLAVIVITPLVLLVLQLRTSFEVQKEKEVDDSPLEGMLPEAVQWIQNFHRIEIKEGKKAWEVEADEAQYLQEREQVLVRSPRASFYLKDGDKVTVSGDHGRLQFTGKDLQRVVLRDNVVIHVRDFVIRVAGARYSRENDRIVADGPVSVVGEQVELSGSGMIVFMKASRMKLRQDVHVKLLPKAAPSRRAS
ncbi:MAG: LPS export ABC transporter periplasmic protein LptC [Candidatus Binatia bacterium]